MSVVAHHTHGDAKGHTGYICRYSGLAFELDATPSLGFSKASSMLAAGLGGQDHHSEAEGFRLSWEVDLKLRAQDPFLVGIKSTAIHAPFHHFLGAHCAGLQRSRFHGGKRQRVLRASNGRCCGRHAAQEPHEAAGRRQGRRHWWGRRNGKGHWHREQRHHRLLGLKHLSRGRHCSGTRRRRHHRRRHRQRRHGRCGQHRRRALTHHGLPFPHIRRGGVNQARLSHDFCQGWDYWHLSLCSFFIFLFFFQALS
mmetsp:Transcript_28411/g.45843  ORF Transcript_28411/g.45843 Transcript_28411/m.45843 type:complete len:253 (+) Transcript_28411:243-1001(+)